MHHLTNYDIEKAQKSCSYSLPESYHQHPDCVRIAYEWLDAQTPIRSKSNSPHDLKHLIERWAGRYVSVSDVEVAAVLLNLKGAYPNYNFSAKLVEPNVKRLEAIKEAFAQMNYRDRHSALEYRSKE
jgi:hypothetical protein